MNLGSEKEPRWDCLEILKREAHPLESKQQSEQEGQEVDAERMMDLDEQVELWEKLQELIEDGETVYAPGTEYNKSRKRSSSADSRPRARKRRRIVENEVNQSLSAASTPTDTHFPFLRIITTRTARSRIVINLTKIK